MLTARSVMGKWSARKSPSACCSRLDLLNLTRWWLRKPKDRNAARNFYEVPISYWQNTLSARDPRMQDPRIQILKTQRGMADGVYIPP
jgi:hypothetical protein